MEIHILSRRMAEKRRPKKSELMIGILDSLPPANSPVSPPESDLRADYLTYTFDDIVRSVGDHVLIDENIARRIVNDFKQYKDEIDSLAVHCRAGLSRSPAVAKALNVGFSLGASKENFKYCLPNLTVYKTIMNVLKEQDYVDSELWVV